MVELQMGLNRDARLLRVLDQMRLACDAGQEHMYMLVPEQSTHAMTKVVCHHLGDRASKHIEVIGFERLMTRVWEYCGGSQDFMDDGGRLLVMAAAVAKVQKTLGIFKESALRPEFLKDLLTLKDSLELHSVSPDELAESAEGAPDMLVGKVADIQAILSAYFELSSLGKLDPAKALDSIPKLLETSDFLEGTLWFVDGFTEFPAQQLRVISSIMAHAERVLVTLPCAGRGDPSPSSACAVMTAKALYDAGSNAPGGFIDIHTSDESSEHAALSYLQQNLCNTSVAVPGLIPGAERVVRLFANATAFEECQHIAATIMRATRNGTRYRDMSIVLCDYDRYAPVMEAVCNRYGIPTYFASTKEEIARKPIMLAINAALDSATRGMGKEDVIKFMKTGMSPLSPEEVDLLENYALTWNLHGRGWEPDTGSWVMHPDGYGREFNAADEERLAHLNDLRVRGVDPLLRLRDALHAGTTLADYVQALSDFLEMVNFTDKLQAVVDSLVAEGRDQTAMEYAQVSAVINNAMEQMYSTVGGLDSHSSAEFAKMFKLMCSTYKIATIPAAIDQVNVFNMQDARFTCSKVRYIVGAEEGCFPAYQPSASLLAPADIKYFKDQGVALSGDEEDSLSRSLSDIAAVVAGAKRLLVFSYATGTDTTPSHLYQRVSKLLPAVTATTGLGENRISDADLLSPEMTGRLVGRISCKPEYTDVAMSLVCLSDQTVQQTAMRVMDKADWALGDLTSASIKGIYGERISLTATRTDTYSSCRYHYFLKYGLGLKEPYHGRFTAPVFGSFAHQVLEGAMKELEALGGAAAVSNSQVEEITQKHIDAYTQSKMKGLASQPERYTYLYHRNCREIISIMYDFCDELRHSDFRPASFELKLGGEGAELPAIPIKGAVMDGTFTGVVDRVDTCRVGDKDYFRVNDYKTGKSKMFDMSDILSGLSMQLLTYQSALRRDGLGDGSHPDAAGVLYVPAKTPIVATPTKVSQEKVVAERQKMLTRRGILLNDKEVINAMEHIEERSAKYLPVKFSADGALSGDVCSAEQLKKLDEYTELTMSGIVNGIASGTVAANPISRGMDRNACTYCPMRLACHKDSCGVKFRYRTQVDAEQFWQNIEAATSN